MADLPANRFEESDLSQRVDTSSDGDASASVCALTTGLDTLVFPLAALPIRAPDPRVGSRTRGAATRCTSWFPSVAPALSCRLSVSDSSELGLARARDLAYESR